MRIPLSLLILLLQLAGLGQLVLAAGSLAIPRILGWSGKLAGLDPFMRRLFWVYGGYILGTNIALGLVSLLAAPALATPGPLALALNLYALAYWGARILIQFSLFQKYKPQGRHFWIGELALAALFIYLTAVYAVAALNGASG